VTLHNFQDGKYYDASAFELKNVMKILEGVIVGFGSSVSSDFSSCITDSADIFNKVVTVN